MTRRQIDGLSSSSLPLGEAERSNDCDPPPPPRVKISPMEMSPVRDVSGVRSPALLATMTPVNVMELKKEMEDESAMGRPPQHAQVKTEVLFKKDDVDENIYSEGTSDKNSPIDLIYEDCNKTVIYTTAPDQKGLEIYSANNTGEITINNISGHQIADVLIDGNSATIVNNHGHQHHHNTGNSSGAVEADGRPPGTVSVVLQGSGQGLLQYPHQNHQVPSTTVLVLSELVEDVGVPLVGLRL